MAVSTEVIDQERLVAEAERLAARYRLRFVKLEDSQIDYSLINQLPVDLMLRHRFVPLRNENGYIVIAMADPSDLPLIDELRMQLGVPVKVEVATWSEIEAVLRKGDATQRVLQEATEGFRVSLVQGHRSGRRGARPRPAFGRFGNVADHQAGRHDSLHSARTARLGYSHRDTRKRCRRPLPHRRRARRGRRADRHQASPDDHLANQGDVRA